MPITDVDNSGAIIEDEIKSDLALQQRKAGIDNNNNMNLGIVDAPKTTNDGLHYQTNVYTVVVNETKELRLQCAYHANPDKLRTPVKWLIFLFFFYLYFSKHLILRITYLRL